MRRRMRRMVQQIKGDFDSFGADRLFKLLYFRDLGALAARFRTRFFTKS